MSNRCASMSYSAEFANMMMNFPSRMMSERQREPLDFGDSANIYSWWDISRGLARSRASPYEIEIEHNSSMCVRCATHIIQQSIPTCLDNEYMTPHVGVVMSHDIVDCSLANNRRMDDLAYIYVTMDSLTVCRTTDRMYSFNTERMETQIVPIGERLTPNYCAIFGKLIISTPAFTYRPQSRVAHDRAQFEFFRESLWDQIGVINILGEDVMDGIVRLLSSSLPVTERHTNNVINQLRSKIKVMKLTTSDSDHNALHEQLAMVKSSWNRLLEGVRYFKLKHYPLVHHVDDHY